MQRQYRVIGSIPETIETDQEPVSNNSGMSQRSSMNNFLNPVERRLSNNSASYNEASCVNAANHNAQSFSEWNSGESSSRLSLHNQETDEGVKSEEGRAYPVNARAVVGPRSEGRCEQNDIFLPGRSAPSFSQGSSSNNISPNLGYLGDSSNGGTTLFGPNRFNSDFEQASTSFLSDAGPSTSSSYLMEENSGDSGGWGLSCKRKALEGTSGHSYPGGSSSSFPPQAENVGWHTGNASSSLSLSPPFQNSPPDFSNARTGLGMRGLASDSFPSSSVSRRFNSAHQQESLALNSSSGGSRHPNAWSLPQPPIRSMAATNSNASQGPLHGMQTSRSLPFPWNGSRAGNSSSSFERVPELTSRSISRTSAEPLMFVAVPEMRYVGQDPSGWSLAARNMGGSGSRMSPSTSVPPLPTPTWFPAPPSQQRFTEFAPWSLFPSTDSESGGGRNGHYPPLTYGLSVPSQDSGQQTPPRGAAFLMEGHGDDFLGTPRSLRALAADIEGRRRLLSEIRQVLNAMHRGENVRIEDYIFDPFMHHGMADIHDRHRDMRLDVDNMSYEELLALGERIGDVSTGLSEGTILKLMKQTKYFSTTTESRVDVEPCSICQEEYVNGDEMGNLECGHDFHTNCIKQWLMLKNACPICKTTALPT